MKKRLILTAVTLVLLLPAAAWSHCEIPCGIYDDQQRLDMVREHITTVEKSMTMITRLSVEGTVNYNQLVRWIDNKETHAQKIQDIVFQYFMAQRIHPASTDDAAAVQKYEQELTILHRLAIAAMKAKQTTDLTYVEQMRELVNDFIGSYFQVADDSAESQ